MSGPTRHRGRWTMDDRCASPWHYLPVEVPPGQPGCGSSSTTTAPAPSSTWAASGPAGFRGWSGGARSSFVITAERGHARLPARRAGARRVARGDRPVPAARRRRRLLGHGCGDQHARPAAPGPARAARPRSATRPPRRELPARPGHRWLAGDLHTHTVHSDGELTVPELARFAAAQGPRLPGRDRPQHDQPPRRAARRRGPVRDHPDPRPGGHHRGRARGRARRRGLDRLPRAARRVAGRDRAAAAACCR